MKLMKKYKIIIVTGLSGAGRTSALKIFEDIGFEVIDNLPIFLIEKVIESNVKRNLAVGIDARTRDFDPKKFSQLIEKKKKVLNLSVLFFDCNNQSLLNRFKESRRLHPIKLDLPITQIIDKEREWLKPLLYINDHYLDTSHLTINLLKNQIMLLFDNPTNFKINIRIISFGYKYGIPHEADFVFDMRFLKNPFYEKKLRDLNGKDRQVVNFIKKQKQFLLFFDNIFCFFDNILDGFKNERKDNVTIAFGCTGGVHRSVVSCENFFSRIKKNITLKINIEHRDLKK